MALIQSTPVPLFTGRPTGIPIIHHTNQTPLDSWPNYTYNQLDSSSGQFQTVLHLPHQAQPAYHLQQSASHLALPTASCSNFTTSNPPLPQPPLSDITRTSPIMAQYAHDTMGGNFIHYTQQFLGSGPPPSANNNTHHNTPHLSPLMTHQPLSHTRGGPISPQTAQPMQMQMQMAMPTGANGYQAQSMSDMAYRTPGYSSNDITSPGPPILMLAEDMGDGRSMYPAADRSFSARYDLESARGPLSPTKVQGWPHDEHRLDAAFHIPQTPLLEESMMGIQDEGWESQEPARKTARAVIANMTEQERLERRREQNRVSQAKLRKTRDAQYEKVCKEKKDLQATYDQLRLMYNHAIAELSYFHDKELARCNAKREQKCMAPYNSFEQLVRVESDISTQIGMRQEQRLKDDEERVKEQLSRDELAKQQEQQRQELETRRSSDEHSQSVASEQMNHPPSSSGTDASLTSIPASLSTVNGGQTDDSPFSYTVSSSPHGPTRRTGHYAMKPAAKSRKGSVTSPVKKGYKRPTSQQSEDYATTELSNSMYAMPVPIPDYNQQPQGQMHAMSAPSDATGSYFMAPAPASSLTR